MVRMTCLCGAVFHSIVTFLMIVTLNVCVNSNNNSLFVLLVSNNFLELKSTVFKRFRVQNLFQAACSGNNPFSPVHQLTAVLLINAVKFLAA